MLRKGNIYDQICSLENLRLAYQKARRGKGETYGVKLFEKNLEENLNRIHGELCSCTYRTSDYSVFTISDPKLRTVYRLPFRDRIVHHAIMNVVEDIWTSVFITHTYACIKGRGIHRVLRDIKRDLNDVSATQYCLKLDITKFYPSIDHNILKGIIRRKIKDVRLLNLLDGIIDSAPGVPIGNYLSQFLANLYLSYFDHWLKEDIKVKYYYRYADDIVILSNSKDRLHQIYEQIDEYMYNQLKLKVKNNYQIFPVKSRGIDFVGYVFYNDHILMRKTIKKKMCRKAYRIKKLSMSIDQYRSILAPWLGWAKHCNSKNLLKKIIGNEKVLRA